MYHEDCCDHLRLILSAILALEYSFGPILSRNGGILAVILALLVARTYMIASGKNALSEHTSKLETVKAETTKAEAAMATLQDELFATFHKIERRLENEKREAERLEELVGTLEQRLESALETRKRNSDNLEKGIEDYEQKFSRFWEKAQRNKDDIAKAADHVIEMVRHASECLEEQAQEQLGKLAALEAESDALSDCVRDKLRSIEDCFQVFGSAVGKQIDHMGHQTV